MNIRAADILLVEDSPTDIELFRYAMLQNQSAATLAVARDGVEAVAALLGAQAGTDTGPPLPRLVLLDLNMPRMGGFQVLERLRAHAHTRTLTVLVFSASDQAADEREAQRLGANAYVRKPLGFDKLCATLAAIERDWLVRGPS